MIRKDKSLLTLILFSVAVLFAVNSQANSIPASLVVSYEPADFRTIKTTNEGNPTAVQFNIGLTAAGLSLKNYSTYGYCVELHEHIGNGTYSFGLLHLDDLNNSENYYKAAWIMDQYAPGRVPSPKSDEQRDSAGAVQGIIWELTQSAGPILNTGNIGKKYSEESIALKGLTLDSTLKSYLSSNYMIAHQVGTQDLIVKVPNPVPEPATMLLFGAGLVGLAGLKRKRKASK